MESLESTSPLSDVLIIRQLQFSPCNVRDVAGESLNDTSSLTNRNSLIIYVINNNQLNVMRRKEALYISHYKHKVLIVPKLLFLCFRIRWN